MPEREIQLAEEVAKWRTLSRKMERQSDKNFRRAERFRAQLVAAGITPNE